MKNLMLHICCLILTTAVATAAEWTVSEPTILSEDKTAGDIFVNAELTLPEGKTLTISNSKKFYLPGAANLSVTMKVEKGNLGYGNTDSQIIIGQYADGRGFIDVDGNAAVFNAYYGAIGGYAVKDENGYINIMRIANGMTDGNWNTVRWRNWYSYKKAFARITFDRPGGALVCSGTTHDGLFSGQTGTGYAFEGVNGADIMFGIGSWWTSSSEKYLLSSGSKCQFKTIGSSDVVFHNHNNAEYKAFILAADTNQYIWAHSGKTIVSNGCVLRVTADYALPNGAQTGILEFRGKANTAAVRPVIDLRGTTQIVNGINDATSHTTGAVTNGSETAATLVFGAHGEDTSLKVGNLYANIGIRKLGAGSMSVEQTVFHGNDISVEGGVLTLANGSAGLAVGSIALAAGTTLVVDGCVVTCDQMSREAGSRVILRNGGVVSGAEIGDVEVEVTSGANNRGSIDLRAVTAALGEGKMAVRKTGATTGTLLYDGSSLSSVLVDEGALRPVGEASDYKFWRFTFSDVARQDWSFSSKSKDGARSFPVNPRLALGRLHFIAADGSVVNSGFQYAGKDVDASSLAAERSTANMPYADASGVNSAGGVFDPPSTLHANLGSQALCALGVIFTNDAPISADNSLQYAFRLSDSAKAPVGYLFFPCVNVNTAYPVGWTVQASNDGLDWVTMDSRANVSNAVTETENIQYYGYGHNGEPFRWSASASASNWQFRPTGTVQVSFGAKLDLSDIPAERVSIADLTVDVVKKGGTIVNPSFAASGVIRLTNVTGAITKDSDLGLAFAGEVVGADNIKSWSVTVNGVPSEYSARISAGKLQCYERHGIIIVVR